MNSLIIFLYFVHFVILTNNSDFLKYVNQESSISFIRLRAEGGNRSDELRLKLSEIENLKSKIKELEEELQGTLLFWGKYCQGHHHLRKKCIDAKDKMNKLRLQLQQLNEELKELQRPFLGDLHTNEGDTKL